MEPNRRTAAGARGFLRRHAAWFLVAAAYLIVSPYYEAINNPNENVRVWATRAIVVHHVLDIDAVQARVGLRQRQGEERPPRLFEQGARRQLPRRAGAVRRDRARQAAGAGPRPESGRRRSGCGSSRSSCRCWPSSGCSPATSSGRRARRWRAICCWSRSGLGTMLYPYGGMFVGHALAAAAIFSAFILLDDPRASTRRRAEAGGPARRVGGGSARPGSWRRWR